jgi:rRNA maturation protein Nop10
MATLDVKIACQRCGEQMEMKDPAPGDPWRADQFWVCPRCGRHFWSTYPAPAPAATAAAPAAPSPAAPSAAAKA